MKTAIFAGGCFWCVEHDLRKATGVIDVYSGYTGDTKETANYYTVASHKTQHREAILVEYDEAKTNFKKLTQFFLDHIDPTDTGGQFGDRGLSYKTAIYFKNDEEKKIAEALLKELDESKVYDQKSSVDILEEKEFFKAEEEHQNYAEKNPLHYSLYRQGSGRESFVNKTCQIRDEKKINWRD